ncbi:MAG: helix-turn-helix domain-containing protein [Pseudomonadota bacterium]
MLPITKTSKIEAATCPIRSVMMYFTGKWQVLVLLALEDGVLRFGELKRTVGDITQRVLTENLRSLEREGYLTRTVEPGPPVAVYYELTTMGASLVEIIKPVVFWSNDNMTKVKRARSRYEARMNKS